MSDLKWIFGVWLVVLAAVYLGGNVLGFAVVILLTLLFKWLGDQYQ